MANLFPLALAAALCASLAIAAPRDLTVSWNIDAAKPVNVTLYYESLCPGCHQFILESLIPTWEKVKNIGLMSVVLRPYGNARVCYLHRDNLIIYREIVSFSELVSLLNLGL